MVKKPCASASDNSLHGLKSSAKWTADSDYGTFKVDDSTICITSNIDGVTFNLLYETSHKKFKSQVGSLSYFEVTLLEGDISIGWVTKDEFRVANRTRGMFFNQSKCLTNPQCVLKSDYGDYFNTGTVIGSLLENDGSACSVYFYQNGRCLGPAFRLSNKDSTKVVRFPCLHVSRSAKVEWKVPEDVPSQRDRYQLWSPSDSYKGEWELLQLKVDGAIVQLPCRVIATLDRESPSDRVLEFSVRIGNIFRSSITLNDAIGKNSHDVSFGSVECTGAKLGADVYEIEQLFSSNALARIVTIESIVSDAENTRMFLKGPEMEMTFKVHLHLFEPLTYYN